MPVRALEILHDVGPERARDLQGHGQDQQEHEANRDHTFILQQPEAVAPDERAEVVALGHGVLARLVLRPAVRLGVAPAVDETLAFPRRDVARLTTAVVARNLLGERAVVVASGVDRKGCRQWGAGPGRWAL